jgi:hypothetical protein
MTPDPLARIVEAAHAVTEAAHAATDADQQLHDAVTDAREAGITWAAIGAVLGTTRQSAFKRFSKNT